MANAMFSSVAAELLRIVEEAEADLRGIAAAEAARKPSATCWSNKQVMVHLIDSAAHNHQRFVHGVEQKGGTFNSYDADSLAVVERSNEPEWGMVVTLWASYNRFLAHVLAGLPQEAFGYTCTVGGGTATLGFVAEDYVEHLKHHLNQVFGERYGSTYAAGQVG